MSQVPPKDPITCHVLDTTTGRPAANMNVALTLTSPSPAPLSITFTAVTNADGRITNWGEGPSRSITLPTSNEPSIWTLEFDTGSYYGAGNTFWPLVELSFYVKPGEHYHVPLLLGPYSYTTYRGS